MTRSSEIGGGGGGRKERKEHLAWRLMRLMSGGETARRYFTAAQTPGRPNRSVAAPAPGHVRIICPKSHPNNATTAQDVNAAHAAAAQSDELSSAV